MDYEKKYNEALKRARAYNTPIANRNTKAILESVFPELADSEDERIRKYLIDELKVAKSVGELKFTIPQPTREECIAYLEKQKESLHISESCKENADSFTSEQKPAEWSEEDKRNFYWISTTIQERHLTPEYTQQVHKILTWLESLRPQPSWKPSEEQMRCLCEVVDEAIRKHNLSIGGYPRAKILESLYKQLQKL